MANDSVVKHQVGDLRFNDKVVVDCSLDELSSYYLDKRGGGEVSGAVSIVQYDLSVLSGNIVQTNGSFVGGESSTAERNSFAYGTGVSAIGENSYAVGNGCAAGCYGWYYKYLDLATGTFYLTTEQPDVKAISAMGEEPEVDTAFESGFAAGDVISYVNKGKHDMCATVAEVNGNKIVVGTLNDKAQEIQEEHPNHDDWTIFVPEKPTAGQIWLGECAFAEGSGSKAINAYSHAEGGRGCLAYGQYSHAEGKNTKAAYASHSEGSGTEANGQYSHAEGDSTKSNGQYSHAEGLSVEANFKCSHAEGNLSKAESNYAHAEGYSTRAGDGTTEGGWCSHAEGNGTQAIGQNSHAEGYQTQAKYLDSHAEGFGTKGFSSYTHAEGYNTTAGNDTANGGYCAHAEGNTTTASGQQSHAEGLNTLASGTNAHSEGQLTTASGKSSHTEGSGISSKRLIAQGDYSHAEGACTYAKGNASHAEGYNTVAEGGNSHAEGGDTQTKNGQEHAEGRFNLSHKSSDSWGKAGNTIHSIGIGTSETDRKNAIEVMQNGKVFIKDIGGYDGTNPTATDVKDLATVLSSQVQPELSNYLDKREDAENIISSYNEFTNSSTIFELEDGPQIGFNIDRNVDIQIGGKYYIMPDTDLGPGAGILSNELSVVRGEDENQLTAELIATRGWPNLVTKTNGGSITADVGIVQHNLNILSGNYVQTSTPDAVVNYASKNAFLQADVDPNYGDSYAGTKAFCVLGLSSSTNQIKLSGDIQILKDIVDGRLSVGGMPVDIGKSRSMRNVFGKDAFKEGDLVTDGTNMSAAMFSLTLDDRAASMSFHLSAVDVESGIVTLKESLKDADGFDTLDGHTTSFFEDLWLNDDNAFYLVGFPELGNANVPNNFGQFASGGSVRAIGRQTHAEGRDSIADVRYAHVEGSHCTAAHMATHAEGFRTVANKRYSHSEGEVTKADGRGSHAEGYKTMASGDYSHAEGGFDKSSGGSATGAGSHAEGMLTLASGIVAHAEGNQTQASASGAHAEGQKSVASGNYSHAEGNATSAITEYSHAEGNGSIVSGLWSHAEGYKTSAFGNYSHAEGRETVAGKAKDGSVAAKFAAHAEGYNTRAFGDVSHAAGINVDVNEDYAFGWNGDRMASYGSHGVGTFSINPQNGLSGFYIGKDNFIQCVLSAVQVMDKTQINALKAALGL